MEQAKHYKRVEQVQAEQRPYARLGEGGPEQEEAHKIRQIGVRQHKAVVVVQVGRLDSLQHIDPEEGADRGLLVASPLENRSQCRRRLRQPVALAREGGQGTPGRSGQKVVTAACFWPRHSQREIITAHAVNHGGY